MLYQGRRRRKEEVWCRGSTPYERELRGSRYGRAGHTRDEEDAAEGDPVLASIHARPCGSFSTNVSPLCCVEAPSLVFFSRRTTIPRTIIRTPAMNRRAVSQLFGKPKNGRTATKAPASMMSASSVMRDSIQLSAFSFQLSGGLWFDDDHELAPDFLPLFQLLRDIVGRSGKNFFVDFGQFPRNRNPTVR